MVGREWVIQMAPMASVTAIASQPVDATSEAVGDGNTVDELINLKWMFDTNAVDDFSFDETRGRLLAF